MSVPVPASTPPETSAVSPEALSQQELADCFWCAVMPDPELNPFTSPMSDEDRALLCTVMKTCADREAPRLQSSIQVLDLKVATAHTAHQDAMAARRHEVHDELREQVCPLTPDVEMQYGANIEVYGPSARHSDFSKLPSFRLRRQSPSPALPKPEIRIGKTYQCDLFLRHA
ncbi:hypothetical protein B0H17DRAFT_1203069 [Mycena rosella]|uniref:Uncharacterized protein n=1 Tax=Mycena rosella TaxID=1033263 RepID=A0AAD7DC91_MYCRO|nr:hypothetical protein B0H17DRAFT_1203069 [Mycena rosella]